MGCGASCAERTREVAAKEAELSWIDVDNSDFASVISCERDEFIEALKVMARNKSKHARLKGAPPFRYFIAKLEDETEPCHPSSEVRPRTLRKAFERDKLSKHHAVELLRLAVGPICTKEQLARYIKDLQDGAPCQQPHDAPGLKRFLQDKLGGEPGAFTKDLPPYVWAARLRRRWTVDWSFDDTLEFAECGVDESMEARILEDGSVYDAMKYTPDWNELCLLACEHVTDVIVIQLDIRLEAPDSSSVKLTCTTLAGEEVLSSVAHVQQKSIADIRTAVSEKLEVSSERIRLVSPDCEILQPVDDQSTLSALPFVQSKQTNM